MNKIFCLLSLAFATPLYSQAQTMIPVFDTVLFYDGYAATVQMPAPPPGVIRHKNSLYAVKLTPQQIASVGSMLTMNVTIKASCDNYDRIGNVNLALVPKGAATYKPDSVLRLELGRFITPFMNKNRMPDTVPYTYDIGNVAYLLKESSITSVYDIWVELDVFGVPYAANTEIAACAGRNDVFYGSVDFITDNTPAPVQNDNILIPLLIKASFNNYQAGASDAIGTTKKTVTFNVDQPLNDAIFVLITSNHGANSGGEEYNRRQHYVYFDGNQVLDYKPGRTSCEPFRVYNTQGNGIYGSSPKSDAQWQSFSNWCPGDVIDTRIIHLGAVAAGSHTFAIDVPNAKFVGSQGNFPLSVYVHGKTSGTLNVDHINQNSGINIYPNPGNDVLNIELSDAPQRAVTISLVNIMGQTIYSEKINKSKTQIRTADFPSGVYSLIGTSGNHKQVKKVIIAH